MNTLILCYNLNMRVGGFNVKRYERKYILGLDIGISSVGWGMLEIDDNNNPCRIIDVGSRIFSPGEVEKNWG